MIAVSPLKPLLWFRSHRGHQRNVESSGPATCQSISRASPKYFVSLLSLSGTPHGSAWVALAVGIFHKISEAQQVVVEGLLSLRELFTAQDARVSASMQDLMLAPKNGEGGNREAWNDTERCSRHIRGWLCSSLQFNLDFSTPSTCVKRAEGLGTSRGSSQRRRDMDKVRTSSRCFWPRPHGSCSSSTTTSSLQWSRFLASISPQRLLQRRSEVARRRCRARRAARGLQELQEQSQACRARGCEAVVDRWWHHKWQRKAELERPKGMLRAVRKVVLSERSSREESGRAHDPTRAPFYW